uniref:ST8 alpha-N-acetyl-neuraminide alpha-2,8-sialyltransferase 3 n=1 Tax=Sus scrofa TaxID=9823 RepID=A0A8D0MW07_PIG
MRNCKMARVASVLGLVMLSVALLILSLISYVSLKKENIFTTPKYANPGAPRMYMFHAGFRSSPSRASEGQLQTTSCGPSQARGVKPRKAPPGQGVELASGFREVPSQRTESEIRQAREGRAERAAPAPALRETAILWFLPHPEGWTIETDFPSFPYSSRAWVGSRRSQFALKFLDPSFVPFPHSLTHELQDRPKWTFNRTAFLHQRQEILQHVDVIKNFSLTKNSVRIGQLMHYDYSSHKYVFSISNNFRSLLPDVSPIVNKHYNICAVVGNSGILTGSRCGQQIDKSDFVFRCNFAPTEAFQRDVGRKTNLTTFNPSILEKYYNNLLTIQDRNNFFLSLKKLDGAILWIPAFFFHTSATVTRTLVDFFVEHRGQLKVQLAWPGNIMQHVNRYWKNKHLSPKRLSTGILMYTLASAICEEIHLYGFWPFGFDPNTREDLPYHYYDKKGTKFTTKWQESHQLPAEFQLLYRMHGEGLTKLTVSRCA